MARYTAEEVTTLVDDSDFEPESDSDVEEDPDFPLPTAESDDDTAAPFQSPLTSPATSTSFSRRGIYHLYSKDNNFTGYNNA